MLKTLQSSGMIVEEIKIGCVDMGSKRKQGTEDQISIYDMTLCVGDKLYRNGDLYGEVVGESDSLYFIIKENSIDTIPIPYKKETLRNSILVGRFSLESLKYD